MAAEQCVKNEELVQLSHEDKETLDGLVKAAESELTEDTKNQAVRLATEHKARDLQVSDEAARQAVVRTVSGVLKTFTKGPLNLHDQHKWGGHYVKNPPKTLDGFTGMGAFLMSAFSTPSAGLVYTGKNQEGKDCGWLVAWVNATGSGGKKVYAECGPKSKFASVNWEQVKTNLAKSTNVCVVTDSSTKTKVRATIQGKHAQYALGAAFSG